MRYFLVFMNKDKICIPRNGVIVRQQKLPMSLFKKLVARASLRYHGVILVDAVVLGSLVNHKFSEKNA